MRGDAVHYEKDPTSSIIERWQWYPGTSNVFLPPDPSSDHVLDIVSTYFRHLEAK
jgi:hypothetical protein